MNSLNLLALEWKRFSPNVTFRIILFLYAGSLGLVFFLAHLIGSNLNFTSNGQSFNPTADLFIYPKNWELLAYIGSWVNVTLLGFLGVFMTTLEFSHKTLRQSIIFGLTRSELVLSKISAALALAFGATLIFIITGIVAGFFSQASPSFSLPPLAITLRFFLQSFGYLLLGIVIALLIRQTALATVTYLAYALFVEAVCRWVLYFTVAKTRLLLFLPDSVLESLTPLPVPQAVGQMVSANQSLTTLTTPETFIAAFLYLSIFSTILYQRLTKSDL